MKHAIKLAATLTALTLMISSFSACSLFDKEDPSLATASVYTTQEKDEPTEAEIAETPTEAPTEAPTSEKIETESTETILNLIKKYPIGTAGSTAKSVEIAIRLINFTQSCNADDVKSDAEKFKGSLSDIDAEMFTQCLDEIDYMAQKLLSGKTDSIKQYIEESGEKYDRDNYNAEKYAEILDIIKL